MACFIGSTGLSLSHANLNKSSFTAKSKPTVFAKSRNSTQVRTNSAQISMRARKGDKEILFYDEARLKLCQGIYTVASAVKITLGPKGRNVVLQQKGGEAAPVIVNDGVTIARNITIKDIFEDVGVRLVIEVASKTDLQAGDGTTTSTVICEEIVRQGMKLVQAGRSPIQIKRGIERAVQIVQDEVKRRSIPISSFEQLKAVATISIGNDEEMGSLVAKAFDRIGPNGSTTVEEGKGRTDEVFFTDGMEINQGYISEYFAGTKELVDMKEPRIFITDSVISDLSEIVGLLEDVATAEVPLFIICKDLEGEALTSLVLNKQKGVLDVCAIKAPGVGDRQEAYLRDIAVLTGAKLFSREAGLSLSSVTMADLGVAQRVIVAKSASKLIGSDQTAAEVAERVKSLKIEADEAPNKGEREFIQTRIARLSGGVARFRLGANTELEMADKKLRYEDAINATRAALDGGVVAGGGTALLQSRKAILKHLPQWEKEDEDIRFGGEIVYRSLSAPCRQIAINAGEDGDVVAETIEDEMQDNWGFNARTMTYENLVETGVLDPCKVTCSALGSAASVAALVLTTDCLVVEAPVPLTADEIARLQGADEYEYFD